MLSLLLVTKLVLWVLFFIESFIVTHFAMKKKDIPATISESAKMTVLAIF